jgi:hypothetical protein
MRGRVERPTVLARGLAPADSPDSVTLDPATSLRHLQFQAFGRLRVFLCVCTAGEKSHIRISPNGFQGFPQKQVFS